MNKKFHIYCFTYPRSAECLKHAGRNTNVKDGNINFHPLHL